MAQEPTKFSDMLDSLFDQIAPSEDEKKEEKKSNTFVGAADSLFAMDPANAASVDTIVTYFFARHGQKAMREAEFRVKTYEKKLKRGEPYQVYEIKMKCKHGAHIVRENGKHKMKSCHCLKALQRQRDKFLEHLHNEGHADLQKKQVQLVGTSEYDLSYWWDASKWMSVPS